MSFTEAQLSRYSRHILLPEVGGKGQKKLARARVLIVGAGGLGSPAAFYLAASGVGTLGMMDADCVDWSNLHRQVIHQTPDVGYAKVRSAQEKIALLNPDVQVIPYFENFSEENAEKILREFDIVLDGTDNFSAKFLINDAAYFSNKPLIHAGILRYHGQILTILPGKTACYRCIFPALPTGFVPSCQEAGVMGPLAGVIGTLQATEAMKLILGVGTPLTNALLQYDAFEGQFRKIRISRHAHCPLCGPSPSIVGLEAEEMPICEIASPLQEGVSKR